MLRTREEIALLLKKAEGNLQKTAEIHRELELLMDYIESVLDAKKPSPNRESVGNPYKR